VLLPAGRTVWRSGLRELKAQIRGVFGKVKKKNLGKLYSVERDRKGNVQY